MTPPPVRKPEPCPIEVQLHPYLHPQFMARRLTEGFPLAVASRDFSVWLTPFDLEARALIDLAEGGTP